MDGVRVGRSIRAIRVHRRLRQADLGRRARTSQAAISRIERGLIDHVGLGTLDAVARALGATMRIQILYRGEVADRLLDQAHAAIVEGLIRRLETDDWIALPEATFSVFGERGSIDILAFQPKRRDLLVIEAKTAIGDVQELIATHDRKVRLAGRVARGRGWQPRRISRLLVVAGTTTARRHVTAHAATLRAVYPHRGRGIGTWLKASDLPASNLAGLLFVPLSRGSTPRHRVRVRSAYAPSRSGSPTTPGGSSGPVKARQ